VVVGILLNDLDPGVETKIIVVLDGTAINYYHKSDETGVINTNAVAFFSNIIENTSHTISVEVEQDSMVLVSSNSSTTLCAQ
jgi:hypothetical protein